MIVSRISLPVFFGILSSVFSPVRLIAQTKTHEDVYLFDENMKGATVKNAKYFLSLQKLGDSVWRWETYNFKGPLIRVETFSDREGKVKNGSACYYTLTGDLDSIARFKNGLKDGTFYHLESTGTGPRDSLQWKMEYVYENDRLIKADTVARGNKEDSTAKESVYPGGLKKWAAYLGKNLVYPERAMKENITGLVRALFTVDENGTIGEFYLGRSVEYSIDREVQRVIQKSGRWIPGIKNGVAVRTFKIQPVNMTLR